ncbi:MAG: Asp-tRNA(Asn)/Glu-tRNA(Gln) amidotransferase subunit GatC [Pirellulaceae bacterium]|nr:Asp-tRNA(Asn)/Glu-tRNA(Gln) amidotransferase subunit GatC [Pirellulaceae bacterium]
MALSLEEVRKVALLARLQFTEEELVELTSQMGDILKYVDQLSELDTEGIEPMAHAAEVQNVFADDIQQPSLPREVIMENAPKHDGKYYRVPAVLGDE